MIIDYSMDAQKVSYMIADAGDGFDHKKILHENPVNVNEEMLAHGRGILMAKNCFDEINYNDKANQVTLVKHFNNPPISFT